MCLGAACLRKGLPGPFPRMQAGRRVGVLSDATPPRGCVFVRPGLIDRALNGPRGLITGLYDRNAAHILAGCITAGITPVTLLRGDRV